MASQHFSSFGADLDAMDVWTAAIAQPDVGGIQASSEPNLLDDFAFMDGFSQPQSSSAPAPQPMHQNPTTSFNTNGVVAPLQFDPAQLSNKNVPIMSPVTPPTTASFGHSMKRKNMCTMGAPPPANKKPALLSNFGAATKAEPVFASEPVTPTSNNRLPASHHVVVATAAVPPLTAAAVGIQPLSPVCDSTCSDDEDLHILSNSPTSPLPAPSAQQAAKRRAIRSRALKRQRARVAAKLETAIPHLVKDGSQADNNGISAEDDPDAPVDKKIARAIRNRQAAQRSRVEAKAKMQKLAEDNDELACAVETLKEENAQLQKQLQALMKHTFGEGHNVEDVLNVFSRVKETGC